MNKSLIILVLALLAGCVSTSKRFEYAANYETIYESALDAGRKIASQNKELLNQKRILIKPLWNEGVPNGIIVRDALNESLSVKVWTLTAPTQKIVAKTAAQEADQEAPTPYVLAYRLLDCGVDYGKAKSGLFSSSKIQRIARTRLYYEILHGPGGEILKSGRVEGIFKDIIAKDSKKFVETPDLPVYNYPDAKDIPAKTPEKPSAQAAGTENGGKSFLGKITGLFGGGK